MRYRKKPVEIEAVLFDGRQVGDPDGAGRVVRGTRPRWFPSIARDVTGQGLAFMDNAVSGEVYVDGSKLLIVTPEGVMTATAGDWIIRGVAGELYPCKPEIFAITYELAPLDFEETPRRVAGSRS